MPARLQWMNEEIPWNWFSPWISTWEVLLNSTVEIIHIPHSFWFSIVYFHVQCEKYLDVPLSTEVLTTFRSLDETHISDLRMYSFCQWPKLLSIKMYSRPYMGGTCKGLDASGQLNAVWSHCWSCLNEIRGVPRQAGLSWPDRGGSSISKWPGKCCSGSPKLLERGTCKPDKSNSGEKPCVSSAITLGAKSVSEAGELLFLQALIKGELKLTATKPYVKTCNWITFLNSMPDIFELGATKPFVCPNVGKSQVVPRRTKQLYTKHQAVVHQAPSSYPTSTKQLYTKNQAVIHQAMEKLRALRSTKPDRSRRH